MSNKTEVVAAAPKALLGTKLGMTQVWDEAGRLVPVTVVRVGTNVVTQVRTPEVDGYSAIQLAVGERTPKNVTKPMQGHFAAAGTTPKRHLAEIRTSAASEFQAGQELTADVFSAGDSVDVVGTTKGKGTAGVMKRHGFAGVGASHGSHRNHRKPGSIGGASTPSRVFRGLRMAGRMGNARTTVQNLTIQSVDLENGLLLVAGAVPGNKGGLVVVRTATKGA
ncbi:50S ribosomal protein L3 [Flaviflexus equikiangi]|uniref:Large ribosomal subunit protein uL3 n=1 Tax=Flaviflexus equikiangi TaxID=2758573 RepID=A0ABS2TGJ8_9ACTO|nr:50S ribosomal protein L3 [Flaviflexus equikiangi]MBM9433774.1 50S ribosomal protein L3 [Flaviflexus equikiangi]